MPKASGKRAQRRLQKQRASVSESPPSASAPPPLSEKELAASLFAPAESSGRDLGAGEAAHYHPISHAESYGNAEKPESELEQKLIALSKHNAAASAGSAATGGGGRER